MPMLWFFLRYEVCLTILDYTAQDFLLPRRQDHALRLLLIHGCCSCGVRHLSFRCLFRAPFCTDDRGGQRGLGEDRRWRRAPWVTERHEYTPSYPDVVKNFEFAVGEMA